MSPAHHSGCMCGSIYSTCISLSLLSFFHLHDFMHIYMYTGIYTISKAVNGYSLALYQLRWLSLELPHHYDFDCLAGSSTQHVSCQRLRSNTEVFFCFLMRSSSSLFHWYIIGSCAQWCSILCCCWLLLEPFQWHTCHIVDFFFELIWLV